MRITTKTDYAVILLTELARAKDKPVSLQAVADRFNISEAYLQRIAASLKKAKLIKPKHGAYGGYHLSKKATLINLKQVVESVGDDLLTVPCLGGKHQHNCTRQADCPNNTGWAIFQQNLDELYSDTTIDRLINLPTE
ncbi:MAG: Rrf2 family transcriptional regulator [bacterium]|nr:Rrf2 family transcriptional regulator [bacterium]